MQLNSDDSMGNSVRTLRVNLVARAILLAVLPWLAGCPGGSTPVTPPPPAKPFAGITLKIKAEASPLAQSLVQRARGWAARTGAVIAVVDGPADVEFLTASQVGTAAVQKRIVPVPDELKSIEHPGHWDTTAARERNRLGAWLATPMAFPLAGEGAVLVFRTDKLTDPGFAMAFTAKFVRAVPLPPRTWQDLAEIADTAAANGARGFATADVAGTFLRIAACMDRPALSETDVIRAGDAQGKRSLLSFAHDSATGEPRVASASFVAAGDLLKRLMNGATAPGDPLAAITSGQAMTAVLTLAEVAKLPKDGGQVLKSFTLAPLPGSRTAFDGSGTAVDFSTRPGGNFVPYGRGGLFGAVTAACTSPAAAWELIADLGSPARSIDLLSEVALGAGPFRSEHLEQRNSAIWQRYGFDAAGTVALAEALRLVAADSTANPALALRGPDADTMMTLLETALMKLLSTKTTAAEALQECATAWKALDAKEPNSRTWHRNAIGLP